MKIKKILIITAISIVIGLIAFFNFYPIPTLFESSPRVSIKSEINGYMDSEHPAKNFKDAENRYYVEFSIDDVNYISSNKLKILDENNKKQAIFDIQNKQRGEYSFWLIGKPDTKYKFVYTDIYSDTKAESNFTTPSNNSNLSEVNKIAQKLLKKRVEKNIRDRLIQNLKDNWEYMDIYYTPSEKEQEALADAYWDTIIKDWFEKSQFKLSAANDSSYEFEMDFQWSAPDMDALNKIIDQRESQLKYEFKNDPKKVYQTITSELPTMIKEMPRLKKTEEKVTFQIKRDDFASEIPTVDTYNFRKMTDPLEDLIV